ncbi:MAG: hypothetical protein EZS28_002243 [Streblomastix strix]|uniref:Uncharacterized protein n=1 Tax=Streblomastix strix TaxID=222440 RepID=A0A5J4X4S7_9EUKA|nr:MAG: hypothetical protein EZS28_002243 [Streblomastix strix]
MELKNGMSTSVALSQKPENIANKTYKLKQEFIPYFEKLYGEYAVTIDKGFNQQQMMFNLYLAQTGQQQILQGRGKEYTSGTGIQTQTGQIPAQIQSQASIRLQYRNMDLNE